MKKLFYTVLILLAGYMLNAQNAWINEIHYNNTGTDAGEFIEVVIENPGSLSIPDFVVTLYNGNNGESYDSKSLDQFTVGVTSETFTLYYYMYPENGIQNGDEDGMALSYEGVLLNGQFLSYQGTLVAANGPAAGMTSEDIGVYEDSSTPIGESLQLSGTGSSYGEFLWQMPAAETPGQLNNNQFFGTFNPDPEPTNYPTDFAASGGSFNVSVSWTDATGEQLPLGYILLAGEDNQFTIPEDGTPVADDLDLSDGYAAVNIGYGVEMYSFSGLPQATTYYFKIYPYTNGNEYIDYKTDGSPPEDEATTANTAVILSEDFESQTLGVFTEYSVSGEQTWFTDVYSNNYFAKMSGYSGGDFIVNEDWLISPPINMDNYLNEVLQFYTACNYTGPSITVHVSTDYDGESDPNTANWTYLEEANLSPGNWEWVSSGEVDISEFDGTEVYIAFLFTSTDTDSKTWEIDDIVITGIENVGMGEENTVDFSVFPIPATDVINLQVDNGEYAIELYSLRGKLIDNDAFTGNYYSYSLNKIERGVYFIVLENLETTKTGIRKIVVQ